MTHCRTRKQKYVRNIRYLLGGGSPFVTPTVYTPDSTPSLSQSPVSHTPFSVSCLSSLVSRFLSPASHLQSPIFRLPSLFSCPPFPFSPHLPPASPLPFETQLPGGVEVDRFGKGGRQRRTGHPDRRSFYCRKWPPEAHWSPRLAVFLL